MEYGVTEIVEHLTLSELMSGLAPMSFFSLSWLDSCHL